VFTGRTYRQLAIRLNAVMLMVGAFALIGELVPPRESDRVHQITVMLIEPGPAASAVARSCLHGRR
jgi:hypothetical protein